MRGRIGGRGSMIILILGGRFRYLGMWVLLLNVTRNDTLRIP